ncbi:MULTISPECIES: galactose mutarotase [unclassified Staphylococcus]|uniref:aldose epimerase family protein n=1 Tax=unclassified Staphylococcus TaxID=91994 RepID=UPI0021D36BC0|nr:MULTISPECIES: galactose mutarotase [unclassified Staphylococcus]UXR78059.1 galactose mutarotase [Staphylococcus sp. IVB6227]UXR82222.1 galactose mutarotase [Staphylococcus sp. IVB6214]
MDVIIEQQTNGIELIKISTKKTKVVFSNYGASIVSWKIDDNNIVLGNAVEADEFYPSHPFFFGAAVGRYAGRIENGEFTLNGQSYRVEQNDAPHHLHGGSHGLWQHLFEYEVQEESDEVRVIFTATLQSDQDDFPGDIEVKIVYTYDTTDTWTIEYFAESTEDTLFNPTNHVYFNLNRDNKVIDNHEITSDKLYMFPLNAVGMPEQDVIDLGRYFNTQSLKLDTIFTSTKPAIAEQVVKVGGLDHPFEVHEGKLIVSNHDCALYVETDMPQMVLYTFNDPTGWESQMNIYKPHSGITIETQSLPNDINIYGGEAASILPAHTPFYSKTSYQLKMKS